MMVRHDEMIILKPEIVPLRPVYSWLEQVGPVGPLERWLDDPRAPEEALNRRIEVSTHVFSRIRSDGIEHYRFAIAHAGIDRLFRDREAELAAAKEAARAASDFRWKIRHMGFWKRLLWVVTGQMEIERVRYISRRESQRKPSIGRSR